MRGRLPLTLRRPLFRSVPRGEALPLGLLLLALSSVFAFGGDRSQFYRDGHHDWISGHHAALSANLSAEHGFLGFWHQNLNEDGERTYIVYNRFPIGSYALIKMTMLPAGDGIPEQIYFLAGSYVQYDPIGSARDWGKAAARFDYVIAPLGLGGSLTPGNRRLHLYPFGALPAARARISAREPALRAEYDLRVEGRTLTLLREPCGPDHTQAVFFVEAVPLGAGDRRGERREFAFGQHGVRFDRTCIARFPLPDRPARRPPRRPAAGRPAARLGGRAMMARGRTR